MTRLWLVLLTMIGFGISSLAQVQPSTNVNKTLSDSLVEEVSFIQLIATPERYHGKFVEVVGYMNLEFEGNAIYFHKEDFDHGLTKNGFWVEFSRDITKHKKLEGYSRQYVIIIGIFDMESKGHFGLFSGEIRDITRLDIWNHKR